MSKVGSPVLVVATWSHFHGRRGVIAASPIKKAPLRPGGVWVLLEGELHALMFGERELAPALKREHHAGAE